jgi:hypothetical protein
MVFVVLSKKKKMIAATILGEKEGEGWCYAS